MILSALAWGLIFGVLALGVYISYKIMNIPDLTVDGSIAFGGVVGAVLSMYGHPIFGLFLGFLAGALAGTITGLLHTKLKIPAILSGVLVSTGLISVNIYFINYFTKKNNGVETTSISLYTNKSNTIFDMICNMLNASNQNQMKIYSIILMLVILAIVISLLLLFFNTQLGLSIRATGNNEEMVKASSINTDLNKILSFAIANGIVGLAGALYVQYMRSYTDGMGTAMLVTGLASIIIGETLLGKRKLKYGFFIVVFGAILYRLVYAIAIKYGSANSIKIVTVIIVILAIAFSVIKDKVIKYRQRKTANSLIKGGNEEC